MAFEPTKDNSGRFAKDFSNQARLIKEIEDTQKRINALKESAIQGDKEQEKLIKSQTAYLNKLNKIHKQNTAEIRKQSEDFDEIDNALVSIGNELKNNKKLAEITADKFQLTKDISKAITKELSSGAVKNNKAKEQVLVALDAYKKSQVSIAEANRLKAKGKIGEEQRLQMIEDANGAFQTQLSLVDKTQVTSKELLGLLDGMGQEADAFAKGIEDAKIKAEQLDAVFGSFSGIPAMSEINKLLKTNIRDTLAWKAAVFALGAALGKAAYDYFGAPIKAGLQADRDRRQNEIDGIAEVAKMRKDAEFIPKQIGQERLENEISANEEIRKLNIDAQYAAQKAANSFSTSLQQGAAQFNAASKTALFGNKLGGVGYGAAQLQLAGISAEKIAGAMSSAAAATGKMPTAKAATDMSIMAERTGTSVDDIAQITETFQRIDGMSSNMAMNMAEGMRSMADKAGISLGNLMKEVADASKDALSYQIKSGPALAKQVAFAQSLGVSFGDIAKAGKNMVLNYKDSIKAEMQLSALLGEQVDLSEVRSKFAAGDTEGALKALQAQGLDPAQMDMFQQEALSQALGGMDLQSLSKIATKTGANVGGLTAGKAGAANQQFLGTTQAAQASLAAQEASISAKSAIIDAELSKKIGDAYLADPGYAEYKKAQSDAAIAAAQLATSMKDAWLQTDEYKKSLSDTAQLDFVSGLKESLFGGLATIGGGLAATALDKLIPKGGIGGKLTGAFGLGGGGGEEEAAADDGGGGGDGAISSVAAEIQSAEPVLKKAKPLGKNLAEFGKGIGDFLKNVGKGFGGVIQETFKGISKGLSFFNPAALKGAAILAGVIVIIGAAIAAASWMMGKALPTLAEGLMSFNDVDGKNLALVGLGVTALGAGLAAMGVGSVIAGIGNLVGSLFGGGIEETIQKVEKFANANIDPVKVKANADAIIAYSKAMAMSGLGSAASGLGNLAGGIAEGISKFFGFKPPLEKMKEFAQLNLGDTTKLKTNAEAFTLFGNAMSSFQGGSGTLSGVLGDAIAGFFEVDPPIEQMKKFAQADFGDVSRLKTNAEAFTAFGNAMATYKGSTGGLMETLAQGVAGFLKVESPLDKFKKFAAIDGIDVQKTKNNAEAFTAFGNAMASYQGGGEGFWAGLGKGLLSFFGGGEEDLITKFQRFSALDSGGVMAISNAIGSLNSNLANFSSDTANSVANGFLSLGNATIENLTSDRTSLINAFSAGLNYLNTNLLNTTAMTSQIESLSSSFIELASALNELSNVNVKALNDLPWVRMTAFASAGGGFVIASSAKNQLNITKDTSANIEKISTYHEKTEKLQNNTMIMLLKNLNAIGEASFEMLSEIGKNTSTDKVAPVIQLDGKVVSRQLYNVNQDYRVTGTNAR